MTAESIGLQTVKAHSIIGPSSAERWFNCPGSPRMLALCPEPSPSEFAAEGTVAHTVAADLLNMALGNITQRDLLGEWREADGFKFEVTQEMLDFVQEYVDYVMGIVAEYGLTSRYVAVEITVPLVGNDFDGSERFGQVDARIYIPYVKLVIVDLKYGRGKKVWVEDNKQLLDYALGSWLILPDDEKTEVTQIESVIVQPRKGGISSWAYHVSRLVQFEAEVAKAVENTRRPDAPIVAGDWCENNFCGARRTCPAYVTYTDEALTTRAAKAFKDVKIDLPAVMKPEVPQLPAPLEMTTEQLGFVIDRLDAVESWGDLLRAELQRRAQCGEDISATGYHLEKKEGRRTYMNPELAEVILRERLTLQGKEDSVLYADRKLKTVPQLEKLLGKDFKETMQELQYTPDRGLRLAKAKDPSKGRKPFDGVIIDIPASDIKEIK